MEAPEGDRTEDITSTLHTRKPRLKWVETCSSLVHRCQPEFRHGVSDLPSPDGCRVSDALLQEELCHGSGVRLQILKQVPVWNGLPALGTGRERRGVLLGPPEPSCREAAPASAHRAPTRSPGAGGGKGGTPAQALGAGGDVDTCCSFPCSPRPSHTGPERAAERREPECE